MAAGAVTWNIDFGSVETTFEAPAGGGPVSELDVTLGGATFNTPEAGDFAPIHAPAENHFKPSGGGLFSLYLNPASDAVLKFYTRIDPAASPLWEASAGLGTVIASGSYEIAPIPLPAPLLLMAGALGALGLVGLCAGRA